jgi:alpha-glucuronidase
MRSIAFVLGLLLAIVLSSAAFAEDGYDLWLRYHTVEKPWLGKYRAAATELVTAGTSPTIHAARDELARGLGGMLGHAEPIDDTIRRDGAILFGTPADSPTIASLHLPLPNLGSEGYIIRSVVAKGRKLTVIAANSDVGVLYGAFHFLRLLQTRQPIDHLDIASAPRIQNRILDHWDNLDRNIERGYSGFSIWNWPKLPDYLDPRYTDYARAQASIGINGVVLNNVGAQAAILTPLYLKKAAALADAFRPYGVKVFFSARFSAPIELGGLKTADPLDPAVIAWWQAKIDEIYTTIPDFGGFLVKANSEGQPGPQDYGRTHADGANMLADALAPHRGIVMWRAFVYSQNNPDDRVKQAYTEFVPLDGKFRDNVIVQVKNGPLDFQPREPFSPLFGATPKTNLALEVQVTKEYLGFTTHLVYLGTMWQEVLDADTYVRGPGSTVAKIIDGSLFGNKLTAMAGVGNVGTDRNWSGSTFDQANWYAFGRLAWNPTLSARAIAEEWARMTFVNDKAFVGPVVDMMMGSREAAVDYMTPLGLAHLMGTGHHYGPAPWVDNAGRPDWNPVYYHRADAQGIGVERTAAGSNAVAQYAPPLAAEFSSLDKTPDKYLLWFHHVPWDTKMKSGHTLWDELVIRYSRGVDEVAQMRATWAKLKPYVDSQRYSETAGYLAVQEREAKWWRDACIAYFQSFSKRPLPAGYAPPERPLPYYQSLTFPYSPGTAR